MSHDEIELSHVNDCDKPVFTGGLAALYKRVTEWQRRTFPMHDGDHAASLFAHMRAELEEIRAAPYDVVERADMAILMMGAFDRLGIDPVFDEGCGELWLWGSSFSWRDAITEAIGKLSVGGGTLFLRDALCRCTFGIEWLDSEEKFLEVIAAKMDINEARKWPAPADQIPGQPIEHVRDGLRTLDEVNRLEMERVRNGVLSALSRPIGEDPVKAAQRIVRERDEAHDAVAKMMAERDVARRDFEVERKRAASVIDLDNRVREELGARPEESTATVARIAGVERNALRAEIAKLTAERDEAQERIGRVIIERDALLLEEKDWRADNEALRLERDDVRKVLSAQPNETVTMAAQRVANLSSAQRSDIESLEMERDRVRTERDGLVSMHSQIRNAIGIGETWTSAALIEHAGQLRDDSVAYRSLRGCLVDMLGCPADFSEKDVADMVADRINGPITDAEDDLLEQVRRLEGDVTTLKAALHVATRGRS